MRVAQKDLEASFDNSIASWVVGDGTPSQVATDNALYVLSCLRDDINDSKVFNEQRKAAIDRLVSRSQFLLLGEKPARGLALFHGDQPETGATCQLLYILNGRYPEIGAELTQFIKYRLASRVTMQESFSWHLSSILTMPKTYELALEGP